MTGLQPDGVPPRGGTVTYTAQGYDPDQDQLTWTWAVGQFPCLDPTDPSKWPIAIAHPSLLSSPTTFQVVGVVTSQCVWVFATDRYGAVAARNANLSPANNPPQPVITVVSPKAADSYPAYQKFQLSGMSSRDTDGDPLTYTWSLDQTQVPGAAAALIPCPTATDPTLQCLDVLVSGQYIVSLVVSDGPAMTSTSTTLKVLDDALPCIAITDHDYKDPTYKDDPASPMPIKVKMVNDDGDPYPNPANPLDTVKFTWFQGKNGSGLQYVDNGGFFELDLVPMGYQLGDVADVRLEIHDRNTAAIDALLQSCGDQPLCPIAPGSTCYVRVSWEVKMDL